jgi:hypothetical protein
VSRTRPDRLAVALEGAARRVFASALDWPGWSRSAKTDELAIEALLAYAPRYAPVAKAAGLDFPASFEVDVAERLEGGTGTEFGVPSHPTAADSRPVDAGEAKRLAAIVGAAWAAFERVAAGAPAELRKGSRGGGRDRDKMVGHVIESDWYYAREIGIRVKQPNPGDRPAVEATRSAVLEVLGQPSDGSPLADRRWPLRYAARRVAWHALDHAWEMEDRST